MAQATSELSPETLLPGVNAAVARRFLAELKLLEAKAGETLFREREPGDALFVIVEGRVSLRCDTDGDEVVELAVLGSGAIFGELAVLSPARRSATAIALTPVRAMVLHRGIFNEMLAQRHPAAEALLKALTRRICVRLRQTDARIAILQDALRGASPQDLAARIECVVTDPQTAPPDAHWPDLK
jgi:CRP-like cAMP-binding protein